MYQKHKFTKEKLEILYIEEKLSVEKIARKLHCSGNTVLRNLKQNDIPRRSPSEANRKWFVSEELIKHLYVEEELSVPRIAQKLNVPDYAIYRLMEKLSMPRRGPVERQLLIWRRTEYAEHMSLVHKGQKPWNTGKERPDVRGANNPRWTGGYKPYYGPNWYRQKRKARKRDNGVCQECGISSSEKRLDVHHIIPFRKYGLEKFEEANRLENLITLCCSCHTTLERSS